MEINGGNFMKYKPESIYVLFRNGKRWRHFAARTNAVNYYAACCDLCPEDQWELRYMEVTGDE